MSNARKVTVQINNSKSRRKNRQPKNTTTPGVVVVETASKPKRPKRSRNKTKGSSGGMVPRPSDSKAAVAASQGRRRNTLDYIHKFIIQTVLPESAGEVVRAPCPVNFKNHCAKYNLVQSLAINSAGQLAGRAIPSPYFQQEANANYFPTSFDDGLTLSFDINTDGRGICEVWDDGSFLGYVKSVPYRGHFYFPFLIQNTGTMEIEQGTTPTTLFAFSYADQTIGEDYPFVTGTATVDQDVQFFGFTFDGNAPNVTFEATCTKIKVMPGYLFTENGVDLPETAQTFVCMGLSSLLTFEGSTLENSGSLVIAVTDPDWYPQSADLYAELSKLPDKRYNGPLKRGGYAWWTPAKMDELTPQEITYFNDMPALSAIWFAIKGGNPGDTVKYETNCIFGFTDPSQLFSKVASAPMAPIYEHIYNMFNHLPHCFANDAHHDEGNKVIGQIQRSVQAAVKDPIALGLGLLAVV